MKVLHLLIFWTSICLAIVSCTPKKKTKTHKGGQEPDSVEHRQQKEPRSKFKISDCPGTEGQSPIDLVHPWRVAPTGAADDSTLPGHYAYREKEGRDYNHTKLRGNTWFGRSRDWFYTYIKGGEITYVFLRNADGKPTSEMTIRGVDWDDEYVTALARITWGLGNHRGSEHMVNGRRFPMEIQFLHYRKSDGSLEDARKNKGVLVVALLLELSGVDNPHLEPLILGAAVPSDRRFEPIHGPINLQKILTNDHNVAMNYFDYTGSSTMPPCESGVRWIVFDQPSTVSDRQLGILRHYATDGNGMIMGDNFRPIQNLSGRTVKYFGSTLKIVEDEIPLSLAMPISWSYPATILCFALSLAIL